MFLFFIKVAGEGSTPPIFFKFLLLFYSPQLTHGMSYDVRCSIRETES